MIVTGAIGLAVATGTTYYPKTQSRRKGKSQSSNMKFKQVDMITGAGVTVSG